MNSVKRGAKNGRPLAIAPRKRPRIARGARLRSQRSLAPIPRSLPFRLPRPPHRLHPHRLRGAGLSQLGGQLFRFAGALRRRASPLPLRTGLAAGGRAHLHHRPGHLCGRRHEIFLRWRAEEFFKERFQGLCPDLVSGLLTRRPDRPRYRRETELRPDTESTHNLHCPNHWTISTITDRL